MYNVHESDFHQLTVLIENTELAPKMESAELTQNRELNSITNSSLTDIQLPSPGFKFCPRTIEWMLQHHLSIKQLRFALFSITF